MSQELLERVIALMPLASKDETRAHLDGVCLSKGKDVGSVLLEVCDGHRCVSETVTQVELEIDGRIQIKKTQIPVIKAALKESLGLMQVETNKEFSFISVNKRHCVNYETLQTYPDLKSITPKQGKYKFALNAKYLYEIAKALKTDNTSDHVEIVLDFNVEGKGVNPMLVRKNGKEAVLMPVRL